APRCGSSGGPPGANPGHADRPDRRRARPAAAGRPGPTAAAAATALLRPLCLMSMATDPSRPVRASARFMFAHPAHLLALGFGSGLSPVAPGTAGTLWAWLVYRLMAPWLAPAQIGLVIAVSLPLGWWACSVTARHLQVQDPGSIVWGELVAFALFRFFDAVKPGPVAWADRAFKGFGARGGFGILFDDLVAAFCALLVIAAWRLLL